MKFEQTFTESEPLYDIKHITWVKRTPGKNLGQNFEVFFCEKRAKNVNFQKKIAWCTHFSIGAGAMTKSQNYTNYTSIYRSMSIL